jgi:hypothetical protein
MVFSIALIPPIVVSLIYQDSALNAFLSLPPALYFGFLFAIGGKNFAPVTDLW